MEKPIGSPCIDRCCYGDVEVGSAEAALAAIQRIAELEAALRELLDTFNPEPRMDDIGLIWGRAAAALKGNA